MPLLPPVSPPSPAVAGEIARMLRDEGPSHVAGRYIAHQGLATAARRTEAERRVERAARADAVAQRRAAALAVTGRRAA